jgi:PQQ-like domain
MNNKFSKKLQSTATIILILLMASITLLAIPAQPVQAQEGPAHGGDVGGYEGPIAIPTGQTADYTIHDLAFLSVSPHVIGLGQELLVNVWITFPSGEGKYMVGYKVTITAPDGTTNDVNLHSYVADGTSWFTYVPNQVGEWKFQFFFAGEYFPAGYYSNGAYSTTRTGTFASAIFNPSDYCTPAQSDVRIVTVQNEIVGSWQSPLPTDYWTRPIEPNNREWAAIAGNYPYSYMVAGSAEAWSDNYYGPFITAPNTPHIVWKRQGAVAGIIGGEAGQYSALGSAGTPSVIYMGRCYQTVTKVMTVQNLSSTPSTLRQQPTSVAECYDLRTGQIYYDIPVADGGITPTRINYIYGTGEASSDSAELFTVSGNRLYKINAYTGAITANISLPTMGTVDMFYRAGYYLSYQSFRNNQVNNSGIVLTKSTTGFLVNWSVTGTSTNFTTRIMSNITVTIPNSYRTMYEIGSYGALGAYDPDTGITINQNRFIYGGFYGSSYEAVNLVTGQSLWNISTDVNLMESAYRPTNAWCRNGIYVAEMERGYWQARDEFTGKILWETQMNDAPWGEFWMYDEAAFGDLLYGVGYTGVWALNETNGAIVWHYVDPSVPFETPYNSANDTMSSYSVQSIRVIDGKLFVANDEHTPSQPATRGWGLICLNATTGEKLWKLSGTRMSPGGAADGYLTASSSYDGYLYVLGKGKTATSISAPQTSINVGQGVIISGSVLDMSPAQPGTPCVSKVSMATWMDFLHLQMPIDGFYHNVTITGVPVSIDVVQPNGNYIHIATVTSDASGAYGYTWTTPSATGQYHVLATFLGDDSYGSSYATTFMNVAQAPTPSPTPTGAAAAATASDITNSMIIAVIIIIIAIAVVGALMLRKH